MRLSQGLISAATLAATVSVPAAAHASDEWGLNGTYAATSNGEWARTNEVFRRGNDQKHLDHHHQLQLSHRVHWTGDQRPGLQRCYLPAQRCVVRQAHRRQLGAMPRRHGSGCAADLPALASRARRRPRRYLVDEDSPLTTSARTTPMRSPASQYRGCVRRPCVPTSVETSAKQLGMSFSRIVIHAFGTPVSFGPRPPAAVVTQAPLPRNGARIG